MNIITIDSGTTNTRVCLWRQGRLLSHSGAPVGVRDCVASGSNHVLKQAIRTAIEAVLADADTPAQRVDLALASGMITSALGLYELAHLAAPAGIAELAAGMVRADMPDVCAMPLWFVPGVRNTPSELGMHHVEAMDMMRGEEVEVIGLVQRFGLARASTIVLPGSHTKFVSLDAQQRIAGCATTLAGELLQVLTEHTLLSKSLGAAFADTLHVGLLRAGAAAARKTGLTRACFSVRTLELFGDCARNERANFLLGAVLGEDVMALRHSRAISVSPDAPILIAGKAMLSQAFAQLIEDDPHFRVQPSVVSESEQANLAGVGALAIAARRGLTGSIHF